MAEYINKEEVLSYSKSYNTDGWDSYTPLVVDVEDIEEIPPADVVERSKIDKAIEEMNNIKLVMDCDEMRDYCVEILKRNIGNVNGKIY